MVIDPASLSERQPIRVSRTVWRWRRANTGARLTSSAGAWCLPGGQAARGSRRAILVAGQRDHAGRRGLGVLGQGATVRNASASMARVTHRYQEAQRRTWCSSRPARPLLA